jgi:hypothetical protein
MSLENFKFNIFIKKNYEHNTHSPVKKKRLIAYLIYVSKALKYSKIEKTKAYITSQVSLMQMKTYTHILFYFFGKKISQAVNTGSLMFNYLVLLPIAYLN